MIINYFPLVAGMWMISMVLITNASGILNNLIFKVIPFFIGMASMYTSAKLLGWI